jgi:hypothetical protein
MDDEGAQYVEQFLGASEVDYRKGWAELHGMYGVQQLGGRRRFRVFRDWRFRLGRFLQEVGRRLEDAG